MRAALQHYRNPQPESAEKNESENRKLEMPVLAIGGERSMGSGVEMLMQGFASDVRGSVIKNCGHWIAEEQPEELTNQLLNFFGEQPN